MSASGSFLHRWRRRSAGRAGEPSALPLVDPRHLDPRYRYRNEAEIRRLCASAAWADDTILCRVLGRYKMFVDARDMGLSPHLALDGYWEMWLTEAIAKVVQRGMTVVDIGANLGYYTLLMADLVGQGGTVHAFEPNPRLVELLARSVSLNGFDERVIVHGQALADAETAVRLIVNQAEPKNGYLMPWSDGEPEALLTTRRFDAYPDLASADVVKIDADTSELAIWRGMEGLLRKGRALTIFLEFAAIRYPDPGAFLDEIAAHGFRLAQLTLDDGIRPTSRAHILAQRGDRDVIVVLTR